MNKFSLRKGEAKDQSWLFELYRLTLGPAIELTWGWDEGFQQENFNLHLAAEKFEILMIEHNNIGGFVLEEHEDHLWLEMLLIHPGYQRKGIGAQIMKQLQRESVAKNKVLKLSVIKANPVRQFYLKLGFCQYEDDGSFYKLQWQP